MRVLRVHMIVLDVRPGCCLDLAQRRETLRAAHAVEGRAAAEPNAARPRERSAIARHTDIPGPEGRIPVLDIGPILEGAPGARAELARHVARSCRDAGFLVLDNHDMPDRMVADTFAKAARHIDQRMKLHRTRFDRRRPDAPAG
jgi:hypothetical protein